LFIGALGGPEMFLIVFALILMFGAKKIPELARGLGKGIREFKDASREVESGLAGSVPEATTKARQEQP